MADAAVKGRFYAFHRERTVSRLGAERRHAPGSRLGQVIAPEQALQRINGGRDVYTVAREDARLLASKRCMGSNPLSTQFTSRQHTDSEWTDWSRCHAHRSPPHPSRFGHRHADRAGVHVEAGTTEVHDSITPFFVREAGVESAKAKSKVCAHRFRRARNSGRSRDSASN